MSVSDWNDNDLDLLDHLLGEELKDLPFSTPPGKHGQITRRDAVSGPLSFQQQRLWFLHQLSSGAAAYNICSAFRLSGPLRPDALCQAFDCIVTRHASLRTAIREIDGTATQLLLQTNRANIQRLDWSSLPIGETTTRLEALARTESAHAFDLSAGEPLRIVLVKLAAEEHAVVLTLHHIVGDAWSLSVLMDETARAYAAIRRGRTPELPELPIQYLDYAHWQHACGQQDHWDIDLAYWKTQLDDLPTLELPTDKPRPPVQSFDGATVEFAVPITTSERLRCLATEERTTLFCLLLSAFQSLLARHTRQSDLAVGTSLAGREMVETEALIGFFANTLVIRARIASEDSFRQLTRQQSNTMRDAVEHAAVPYDQLVSALGQTSRDPSRNPLFQVAFTLLNIPAITSELDGLRLTPVLSQEAARFDLELFMRETENGLSGAFSYNTKLFERLSIERLAEQLVILLEAASYQPDSPLATLPLTTPQQAETLLTLPKKTVTPNCEPVHRVFSRFAAKQPDVTALRHGDLELSYGELDRLSDAAAKQLVAAGVKPGEAVGLWMEPSFELLISLLAVLKAGAGYVPMDPGYPSDRIHYMLEDSGVCAVLSTKALAPSLPSFTGTLVLLDVITPPPSVSLPISDNPDGIAYIIYTSGSTGRPKGVAASHRNCARLFSSTSELFKFGPREIWTFFHSYAFDFSVWEIWGALANGGILLIVPPLLARSSDAFYQLLCHEKVTVLSQTPSAFRQLMAAEELHPQENNLALRYIIFGGEALDLSSLEPWVDRHGDDYPMLINMYGITETTVHVTFRRIGLSEVKRNLGSVIGAPLHDLCIRLLDENLHPVPPGMVGEIYVGGAGVTLGYLNQPELSAQRFMPDPNLDSGLRFYRSGDLARITPRGELEYRGRADQQVKLRGFRIETAEIQALLSQHPSVAEAAVTVRGEGDLARLIAYVSKRPGVSTLPEHDSWLPAFDMIYEDKLPEDTNLDVVGWNDSYDQTPIPIEHMQRWRDEIIKRIHALHPRQALEIGVGSGMLLLAVAPGCQRYHGVDFSARALERLGRSVAARGLNQVQLEQREARDLNDLPEDFDTVIINSVAQYFPNSGYFLDVIDQAMTRLRPGGNLLLGDLRHLGLLRHFHASRLLHHLLRSTQRTRTDLRRELEALISEEKELLVDPVLFRRLARLRGDIAKIEIRMKEDGGDCELTTYRYDVVLSKGRPTAALTQNATPCLRQGLTNRRTVEINRFLAWLEQDSNNAEVIADQPWRRLVLPEASEPSELLTSATEKGLAVRICWSENATDGRFDLALASSAAALPALPLEELPCDDDGEISTCFNIPAQNKPREKLGPELRHHLAARLPDYMLPAAFVVMDKLPLTSSGKLDWRALPEPGQTEQEKATTVVPPRGRAESEVARVWGEVLDIDQLGRHQNFFEAGGHSLLATRVMSKLRQEFGVELPLRTLFEHPTVAEFAVVLAERVTLEELVSPMCTSERNIPKADRSQPLLASFAQQRFWFLERLDQSEAGVYNIAQGLHLRGRLDLCALRAALTGVVRRHEALRTRFRLHEGELLQIIDDDDGPDLHEITLNVGSETPVEQALRRAAEAFAKAKFDLEISPPLRFALLHIAPDDAALLIVLHHALSDGWSLGVLVREFGELYAAALERRPPRLPSLPIQYIDFAQWQRKILSGEHFEHMLSRWKTRLAEAPAVLNLLGDRQRDTVGIGRARRGRFVHFDFSPGETQSLHRLAERAGGTLFMVLLAGYAELLSRYSGQSDLVIGTPIANRQHADLEGLIGCFVNTLALRVDLARHQSTQQLLMQVRDTVLEAYELQDLPFETIVDALKLERSLTRNPLFQTMLVLQNAPLNNLQLPGLELEPMASNDSSPRFDLTLTLHEADGGLHAMLEYDIDLFEETGARRMAYRLQKLLRMMAQQPERLLSSLELLDEDEEELLLLKESDTIVPATLLPMIEANVATAPDATAVSDEYINLSYGELNRCANQLARRLISLDIGSEDIVAIALPRGAETVVAILAVLKAGAAYMPLDLDYPSARIAFMLHDAVPRCVLALCDTTLPGDIVRLNLDDPTLKQELSELPDRNPGEHDRVRPMRPEHPAYVIYTSGSTGMPKGTVIQHENLYASTVARIAFYPEDLSRRDTAFLLIPSFAFDSSVALMFWSLTCGGRLVISHSGRQLEPGYLAGLVEHEQAEVWLSLPSLYRTVAQSQPDGWGGSLSAVLFGGEKVAACDLIGKGRRRFYNEYGPTEATVWSTATEIIVQAGRPIDIGRPIPGYRAYILNQALQATPPGLGGEIYLAGHGIVRGYLRQPRLTSERFLPNPFRAGERMYRTGDCGRWLDDGRIEYLGRADEQLKLRGYRIEPVEIETALCAQPGIAAAAVSLHHTPPAPPKLVGYLVLRDSEADTDVLRRSLAEQLPEHMIPNAWVILPALPQTPNGKLDRRALPAPELAFRPYRAPQTILEKKLASIFAATLGLPSIGMDDGFFDMGGHSLLTLQLLSSVREELGVELPLASLFTAGTVAEFSRMVSEAEKTPEASVLVPIRTEGDDATLLLVHDVSGQVIGYQKLVERLSRGWRVYGLQSAGLDPSISPDDNVAGMTIRYTSAILQAGLPGPFIVAGHSFGAVVAAELAGRLIEAGAEVSLLAALDAPPYPDKNFINEIPQDEAGLLYYMSRTVEIATGKSLAVSEAQLRPLDHAGRFALMNKKVHDSGLFPQGIDTRQIEAMFEVYRNNLLSLRIHQPKQVPCAVAVWITDSLGKNANGHSDLGWSNYATGPVQVFRAAGQHSDMLREPHVSELAKSLDHVMRARNV